MNGPAIELLAQSTATAAAERVVRALVAADAARGAARLAIPGGSAAVAMIEVLQMLPASVRRRLSLTWVDERCVDAADPASNHGAARRAGLVPEDGAAALPLWSDGASVADACAAVTNRFAAEFAGGLDVALLGIGEDGHVASLFPGHAALHASGVVAHVADSPKPPPNRMTLTLPVLRAAGVVVLLASGEGKRAALLRVLRGDPALPTSRLERLVVVTDLEVALREDQT